MPDETTEPKSAVAGKVPMLCPRCGFRPHMPLDPATAPRCFYCATSQPTVLVPIPPPTTTATKPEPFSAPPAGRAVCVVCKRETVNAVQGKDGATCTSCWREKQNAR